MTIDKENIAKRISDIQTAMDRLKKYAAMEEERFILDIEKMAAAKYHLLTIIEACISICVHIAAKTLHKVPEGYGGCFKLLVENGVLEENLGKNLSKMAAFRNILIHQYWDIDDKKVHRFILSGLDDVKAFVEKVAAKYLYES